jgi:hypothetical protein
MSIKPHALMGWSLGRSALPPLLALLLGASASLLSGGLLPRPASAAIGAICPTPTSQVSQGIDVCVDRGDNATYQAGDLITVCVSANIPQIMIFPPPPPPTIKVENVLADGSTRLLIEAQMASGQQCSAGTIVEPFGQETIRAQAIGQDGKAFQEDTATITTAPR